MHSRTAAFHWSGGKDSALALNRLLHTDGVVVDRLVTLVHGDPEASPVHDVPLSLLEAQAGAIGIPLETIRLEGPGLEGYDDALCDAAVAMRADGIDTFAFGDLDNSGAFDDRVARFAAFGLEVTEPLAGMRSPEVVAAFLRSGIRAVTIVVDADVLARDALGAELNAAFFAGLPPGADPCGESGEYHSFAFDGPLFDHPVPFSLGPPTRTEREIGTTSGPRHFTYWTAAPSPPE